MKNICTNCGAENEINSKYCSICGYKLPIVENEKSETQKNESTTSKKKVDIKTFIGFIVGFTVVFFVTQSLFKPSIDKQLAETANEMNKTCPMAVDEYTTLKNVIALPNKTFQYNYILANMIKADVKLDTVKKYVFPKLLENIKTSPIMKSFRDNKVTLNYYYLDKNGEFVTEYKVTPEMYK